MTPPNPSEPATAATPATAAPIATRPEDMLDRAAMAAMSGLDYLRGLLDGRFPHPPIAGLMSYRMTGLAEGRVSFRATPGFQHLNPMGTVHGGWYGTLLDSAMGCAVMSRIPAGHWYTTLEYRVNLLRAVPLDTEVEAVAKVRHAGRTTGVAEADLRGVADGRLYATGSTTCLILPV